MDAQDILHAYTKQFGYERPEYTCTYVPKKRLKFTSSVKVLNVYYSGKGRSRSESRINAAQEAIDSLYIMFEDVIAAENASKAFEVIKTKISLAITYDLSMFTVRVSHEDTALFVSYKTLPSFLNDSIAMAAAYLDGQISFSHFKKVHYINY